MKRLLALLLSATMVLGFTGCGASSTGDTAKSDEKVPEVTIGQLHGLQICSFI